MLNVNLFKFFIFATIQFCLIKCGLKTNYIPQLVFYYLFWKTAWMYNCLAALA